MELFKNDFMNKILILGASGLLGESLVDYLLPRNFQIGALSRNYNKKKDGLNIHTVDVLDYESLETVVGKYDVVINCIGQITNPINGCITLNTKGIENIIHAVKKSEVYLIHLSTVSVYGSSLSVSEESPVNPESVYGSIKYFSEYQISQSLTNYVILRISNLYGKGQVKGILGYILRSFYNNERKLSFDNNGSLKRYYLHIDDLSSIIELTITKKINGVYNIIGNDFLTIKQLVSLCEKTLNYSFDAQYNSNQPIENIENIENIKLIKKINYSLNNDIEKYLQGLE
jgi:nucleoside-diphosphate-sugar epimerase